MNNFCLASHPVGGVSSKLELETPLQDDRPIPCRESREYKSPVRANNRAVPVAVSSSRRQAVPGSDIHGLETRNLQEAHYEQTYTCRHKAGAEKLCLEQKAQAAIEAARVNNHSTFQRGHIRSGPLPSIFCK